MRNIKEDNRGSFTLEAVFVMLIIIGVTFSLLYVSFYCMEEVCVEEEFRSNIRTETETSSVKGLLGKGELRKKTEWNVWCSVCQMNYQISGKFPFTKQYLNNGYGEFIVDVRRCSREAAEFVRMYDVLKNKR